jgi:hypothetical protein
MCAGWTGMHGKQEYKVQPAHFDKDDAILLEPKPELDK